MSKRKDAELQQTKTEAFQFKGKYAKHLSGLTDDKINDIVDDRVYREYASTINAIEMLKESLKESGTDTYKARRLLAGLEALERDVERDYYKQIATLNIANKTEYDSSGSISKSERKIIKTNLKDMKYRDKQAESYKKWMGKQIDENGGRVRDYLSDVENEVSDPVRWLARQLIVDKNHQEYHINKALRKLGVNVNSLGI